MCRKVRLILFAFAALSFIACLPSTLCASCGDYLTHAEMDAGEIWEITSQRPEPANWMIRNVISAHGMSNRLPTAPCRNGECRSAPQVPPAPTATIPVNEIKTSSGLMGLSGQRDDEESRGLRWMETDRLLEMLFVREIEHPPRS